MMSETEILAKLEEDLFRDHLDYLVDESAIKPSVIQEAGITSIETIEELKKKAPKFGDKWSHSVPGMLFLHRDGTGRVVTQYRPNSEALKPGAPKYEFPKGCGPVQNILPSEHAKVKNGATTLFVPEGTKQYLAWVSWLDDKNGERASANEAGVTMFTKSRTKEEKEAGKAVELAPLFHDLVTKYNIQKVVLIPDSDFATNDAVNRATRAFAALIQKAAVAAKKEVSVEVIKLPGGAKEGIDDLLAAIDEDARTEYLEELIATSRDLSEVGRAGNLVPRVNFEDGVIEEYHKASLQEMAMGLPAARWEALCDFAARIVRTRRLVNDLAVSDKKKHGAQAPLSIEHVLEVKFRDGYTTTVGPITRDELNDVSTWLSRVPGRGTSVQIKPGRAVIEKIVAAIIGDESARVEEEIYARVGWLEWEGKWGYLHNGGFLTAEGNQEFPYASLSDENSLIDFSGLKPLTGAEKRAWFDTWVLGWKCQHIPVALLGFAFWVATGMKPKSSIMVTALRGSGKTITREALAALWGGLDFAQVSQLSSGATSGVINEATNGLENAMLLADDMSVGAANAREQESIDGTLIRLLRISYANSVTDAKRTRLDIASAKKSGTYEKAVIDRSQPGTVLFVEKAPQSQTDSGMERTVGLNLEKNVTSTREHASALNIATPSGARLAGVTHRMMFEWIMHIARLRDEMGAEAFVDSVHEAFEEQLEWLREEYTDDELTDRQREVVAVPMTGFAMFNLWLVEKHPEAFTLTEAHDLAWGRVAKELGTDQVRHGRTYLNDQVSSSAEAVITRIRSKIASGKLKVKGLAASLESGSSVPVAGAVGRMIGDIRPVNFVLGELATAIDWKGGLPALVASLRPVIIGGQAGTVKVNGVSAYGVKIPIDTLGIDLDTVEKDESPADVAF